MVEGFTGHAEAQCWGMDSAVPYMIGAAVVAVMFLAFVTFLH